MTGPQTKYVYYPSGRFEEVGPLLMPSHFKGKHVALWNVHEQQWEFGVSDGRQFWNPVPRERLPKKFRTQLMLLGVPV